MPEELENRVAKVEDRLDRVERLLELASTITLNVAQQREEDQKAWKARMEESDKRMKDLEIRHAEIDEALSALIYTVDEWIRNKPSAQWQYRPDTKKLMQETVLRHSWYTEVT